MSKTVSPSLLHELLRYEPETGKLYWLQRAENLFANAQACCSWNTKYAGHEAFKAELQGYRLGTIQGWKTYAHRVVWAMIHGEWPSLKIDHVNGNRSDNRISNLRMASDAENAHNSAKPLNNTSGYIGVIARRGGWQARISIEGKAIHLGDFPTADEAHAAYSAAAVKYHGEFARIA